MAPSIPPGALWAIDGHSQIFRAYYAIRSLSTLSGQATNAVFGFMQILRKLRQDHSPEFLVVTLDRERSFRNDLYPEYKANRSETPADLISQAPIVERVLSAMNVPMLSHERYEADDYLATLARLCAEKGKPLVIVSADKDLFQLVNEHVFFLRMVPGKNEAKLFDPAAVEEEMGVPPRKMVDYQSLVGDTSDNIPGVPGIGPKSAVKLLAEAESLEDLLANLDRVENKRWRKLLEENADKARMAWKLAKLDDQAPVPVGAPEDFAVREPDRPKLEALYRELEFNHYLEELRASAPEPAKPKRELDYKTLTTPEQLKACAEAIKKAGRFAFDTETTGVESLAADLVGISLAWEENQGVYIPVGHTGMAAMHPQATLADALGALKGVFADENIPKVAHNAKFDLKMLERHGFEVKGFVGDTMIAAFLIDSERGSLGLKPLSQALLGMSMKPIAELIGKGRDQITMADVEIADAAPYACADADATLRLDNVFGPMMAEAGLQKLYEEMEIPLLKALDRMERRGIAVDVPYLERLRDDFRQRVSDLRAKVWEQAGEEFNLNSPKQVGEVLFGKLGLEPLKKTKTGNSTNAAVLEQLRDKHPAVATLLEYRLYDKLMGTYVGPLPKMVNPRTGRVHASFSQTSASTGRLACHDPNLQNIPIRTEAGRSIRKAFVASGPDRVLVAADYSQVELRIMAHIAGDEAFVQAFKDGLDPHALTASKIFGVAPEDATSNQRAAGKRVNFGVLYGISAFRLARELGVERKEGAKFIDEFFAGYPAVARWIEETKKRARETGWVETLLGRRRRIPEINHPQGARRQAAERAAVNAPIQGSAADLIKLAMIEMDRRLPEEIPGCHMVLQVHDELVLDCPASAAEEARALAREIMEGAQALSVPLAVDAKIGKNWDECK